MAIIIGILVLIVARALPEHEVVVSRIPLVHMPLVQLLVGEVGTEIVGHEHPQHLYLAQTAAEILPAQGPMGGALGSPRRLDALLYLHAFLKDNYSMINERILATLLITVHDSPSKAVRTRIQSKNPLLHIEYYLKIYKKKVCRFKYYAYICTIRFSTSYRNKAICRRL